MSIDLRAVARFLTNAPLHQAGDEIPSIWTPTERESEMVLWFVNATGVIQYVDEEGGFPPADHPLSVWLAEQQDVKHTDRQRSILNHQVSGWNHLGDGWSARLGEAAAFTAANERVPNPRATDATERSIGRWVEQQRLAARDETYSPRRRAALDARVPGWTQTRIDARWTAQHKVVADHYEAHGVLPTAADNQRAADWIEKQAERLPSARTERRSAADALTPGLASGVAESKWIATSIEVAEFSSEHGRLPSRKATGDAERLLGAWLHNQRIRLRGDAPRVQARVKALDALVDGWRGTGPTAAAA